MFFFFFGGLHPANLISKLRGRNQTSVRTELRAVLAAVARSWAPVHIKCDCEAVVNAAHHLFTFGNIISSTNLDLWHSLKALVAARGPQFAITTWAKGHATDDDIAEGISIVNDRYGNTQSDQLATAGRDQHQLLGGFEARLAQRIWVAAHMQRLILDISTRYSCDRYREDEGREEHDRDAYER